MKIYVTASLGTGPTKLAAFDSALNSAGIANYNLIRLSSVIPPKSEISAVEDSKTILETALPGSWGDRLYVVMSEKRIDTPNTEAWAGIGWVQDKKTGKGLFVEHDGESEQAVQRDVTQSLEALMATRNVDFGKINMKVIGKICTHHPVCALAIAVYQVTTWDNVAHFVV